MNGEQLTFEVQFSKLSDLRVSQNTKFTWDFTQAPSPLESSLPPDKEISLDSGSVTPPLKSPSLPGSSIGSMTPISSVGSMTPMNSVSSMGAMAPMSSVGSLGSLGSPRLFERSNHRSIDYSRERLRMITDLLSL